MRKWLIFIFLVLSTERVNGAYQVSFEGITSKEVLEVIEAVSQLQSDADRPPPTFFTLKKRVESDKINILQVLHSYGYYQADISIKYLGEFPDTTIRVQITTGPQYVFGSLLILDQEGNPLCINEPKLSLQTGCPARSDVILDTEEQILMEVGACGYPLATISNRSVIVDQANQTVNVTYTVYSGPLAYFGDVCIDGLKSIHRRYITRRLMWQRGALYSPDLVACTDTYLQESGLFSYVTVRPADTVDEAGNLPILISLEEKRYRHIGAGVSYSTDESFGTMFQWNHDNLTGWGDALGFVGEYSEIIKRGTLLYGMPDFMRRNQDLLMSAEVRREDTPGFIEREMSFLMRISRKVTNTFTYNYGGRYERLLSTKSDNNDNYNLFSLPIQARWDTSNRLLNPTKGTTIAYFGTPYQAFFNTDISFLRQELWGATYRSITPNGGILFAFSGQLGSIVGQSRFIIPAPKRFYAGSSTGLRGYKYLSVSPLDGTKPIGGRSLMIFQIEPRFRIIDNLYFAVFYDIGNVYSSPFPKLNEKLLRSTGCGIRYLTPLGPFRVDVGFPLDRRKGIDKSFQIYASIGQTF